MNKAYIPAIFLFIAIIFIFYSIFFYSKEELAPGVCGSVLVNGGQEEKINILYLGDRYTSLDQFEEDVRVFNEGFFTVEPYISLKDEFNVYTYNGLNTDLGCEQDDTVICSSSKVKRVGKNCPSDFIIVLSNYDNKEDLLNPLRSASIFNLAYINAADSFLVLSHESGHMIAGLADEYLISGGRVPRNGINCAKKCESFDILDECKLGCVNNEHYRSIDLGLMRNYWDTDYFGRFNEKILRETILRRSSVDTSVSFSPSKEIIVLDITLKNGKAVIDKVEEGEGYVSRFNIEGYSYVVESGGEVYRGYFGYPELIRERGFEDDMMGDRVFVDSFTLVVPKGESVEIFDDKGVSLGSFSLEDSLSLMPEQDVSFDVKGITGMLYVYDFYNDKKGEIDLSCEGICDGEISGRVPLLTKGEYWLYYYKVGFGWKRIPVSIGSTTYSGEVELQ